MPADSRLVTIHCKAGSTSVRLAIESRAKCQDFVVRYKEDGISYEVNSPFCSVKTTITVRQSKPIEDRETGKQFAPLWRESWLTSSKFPFPIEMTKVHSSSQRSTLVRMSSASKIEEVELENRYSNLLLLEAGKHLLLFPPDVLQRNV